VGLGGCDFASMKAFQVLKSSSMFSTQCSHVSFKVCLIVADGSNDFRLQVLLNTSHRIFS
jgi:hypothetical protein